MINKLFAFFIILGTIFGIYNGIDITNLILDGAKKSLSMCISMFPILALWLGIAQIATDSKLLDKLTNLLKPILKCLFKDVKSDKALGYIASNIICEMFGLGNAATPFGLKAMEEMQKENDVKDTASNSMITFMVLNTSGFMLIPTSVIALRSLNNSVNPSYIIKITIISSLLSLLCALFINKIFRRFFK